MASALALSPRENDRAFGMDIDELEDPVFSADFFSSTLKEEEKDRVRLEKQIFHEELVEKNPPLPEYMVSTVSEVICWDRF